MSEWDDYITSRNRSNIYNGIASEFDISEDTDLGKQYVITSRGVGKSIFGELFKDKEESNMNKRNDYIDALKYAYAYDRPMPLTIKNVIFNDPATIVYWSDGTKTVVKRSDEEKEFDKEKGLAMAILKKIWEVKGTGEGYYRRIFKKWIKEEPKSCEETFNYINRDINDILTFLGIVTGKDDGNDSENEL